MKHDLKNIVVINDFDYIQGGASKVAIQTANMLANDGKYNVYFFSGASSSNTDLSDKVIKVCTNQGEALKDKNKIRGFFNGLYNFKSKRQLKKLLKQLNRDETVIHIHGWTKSLSSSVFSVIFKMKYNHILTLHDYFTACPNGGYFNYKKNKICHFKPLSCKCCTCNCDSRNYFFKLYRIIRQFIQNKIVKLNKKLNNVITISNFSENILKDTLSSKTKIYRVYNPIDLDLNPIKSNYCQNEYFLYVGRVSKEKGVDIFCDAVNKLDCKGLVVGDGPELTNLKNKYPNIEFVGWKSSGEVKEYIKKAKALIFPSRWYEASPLTPLEAMQYGIPVISSNCNASTEYINSNFIFSDIDDLVSKMSNINNISLSDNFNNNLSKFIDNTYLSDLLVVYEEVLWKK